MLIGFIINPRNFTILILKLYFAILIYSYIIYNLLSTYYIASIYSSILSK